MLTFLFYSLAGGELFDRIAAEDYKMSEAEVINYMIQVCQGLAHMHENSIVHLDIKVCSAPLFLYSIWCFFLFFALNKSVERMLGRWWWHIYHTLYSDHLHF